MTGTGASLRPPILPNGSAVLTFSTAVTSIAAYTDTPLVVTLPVAGTYEVDADVRAVISAPGGTTNGFIVARLQNDSTGAAIPNTETLIEQCINCDYGGNSTAPISARVTVTGPTVIRLQSRRGGTAFAAGVSTAIQSDANGYSRMRWARVA